MNQSELEENGSNWRHARENASEQSTNGDDFTSDWLVKWRKSVQPIAELDQAKPKETEITYNTQLKTALLYFKVSSLKFKLDS